MALPLATTLSNTVALNDVSFVIASITSLVAGNYGKVDQEIVKVISVPAAATSPVFVLRGQEGTAQVAHAASAQIVFGAGPSNLGAGDFAQAASGAASIAPNPTVRARVVTNYAAAGAIAIPPPGSDGVAIIDGTSTLAMTLANPSVVNDGDLLYVISNGKGAHTVTYTAGVGNGGATMDVGTYNTTEATGCVLIAANGFWVLIANGIGSAGTQVAGVVWA